MRPGRYLPDEHQQTPAPRPAPAPAASSASGGGGGGGSIAIGGFSAGGYNEDWRARCVRVLRDRKKFERRIVDTCLRLVKKDKKNPERRQAETVGGPG